jgi:hypothetical protein
MRGLDEIDKDERFPLIMVNLTMRKRIFFEGKPRWIKVLEE